MNDTKAANKAPAYTEVDSGACSLSEKSHQQGSLSFDPLLCPNCNQHSARSTWPMCSWCRLFLVPLEEVDLTPGVDIVTSWRKGGVGTA